MSTLLIRVERVKRATQVKHLEQFLIHTKRSINVSHYDENTDYDNDNVSNDD